MTYPKLDTSERALATLSSLLSLESHPPHSKPRIQKRNSLHEGALLGKHLLRHRQVRPDSKPMRSLRVHTRLERDVVPVEDPLGAVPRRGIERRIERCACFVSCVRKMT